MRGRRLTILGIAILGASALFTQSAAVPARVVACSCIPPPSLAEVATTEDVAIVAGTVGRALPDRTPVGVETWFHGASPSDVVWLNSGTQMASSCDIFMTAGERRIFVLHVADKGTYSAISCSPNGLIGSPDGDALLEEAIATFGGEAPPTSEPAVAAEPAQSPWIGDGLVWVAGGVGAATLLFGLIVAAGLRARRR